MRPLYSLTTGPARLYGNGDGLDPGIEAFGLSVRIEVGEWVVAVSVSPLDDTAWRGVPLDERLPDLVRALVLMVELRAGARGGETPPQHRTRRQTNYVSTPD